MNSDRCAYDPTCKIEEIGYSSLYVHSKNRRETDHVDMALFQRLPRKMLVLLVCTRDSCTYLSVFSVASDELEAMEATTASTVTIALGFSVLSDFSVGPGRGQLERFIVSRMLNEDHGQTAIFN